MWSYESTHLIRRNALVFNKTEVKFAFKLRKSFVSTKAAIGSTAPVLSIEGEAVNECWCNYNCAGVLKFAECQLTHHRLNPIPWARTAIKLLNYGTV